MEDTATYLRSFSTDTEAIIVAGRLESHGIPVEIRDEHLVSMNWLYSNAVGGVKLFVRESDLKEARELLHEPIKPEKDTSPWGKCPKCHGNDVEYVANAKLTYLSWLFLGIPLFLPKKRFHCQDCDLHWGPNQIDS